MRAPNLASRPFRNEALPALLFGAAVLALLLASLQHAAVLARLRPGRATPLASEVTGLESELAGLRKDASALAVAEPVARDVPQWELLAELVDRRDFRWTELFASLEELLPPGVRLVSVAPSVGRSGIELDVVAVARKAEDGLDLVRTLEERPEFEDVDPLSIGQKAGQAETEYHYSMRYRPAPPGGPKPAASPPPPTEAR